MDDRFLDRMASARTISRVAVDRFRALQDQSRTRIIEGFIRGLDIHPRRVFPGVCHSAKPGNNKVVVDRLLDPSESGLRPIQ